MIIVVADWFDIYKNGIATGDKEYVASHGVDYETGREVILQCVHPADLGAKMHRTMGEWVILEEGDEL